jgi:hypothetical protein
MNPERRETLFDHLLRTGVITSRQAFEEETKRWFDLGSEDERDGPREGRRRGDRADRADPMDSVVTGWHRHDRQG